MNDLLDNAENYEEDDDQSVGEEYRIWKKKRTLPI